MGKDTKLYAFLGVFLTVIGFIIVYATQKKDKYAMFYAKQGLVIFFIGLIIGAVAWIPIIGQIVATIAWIMLAVAWVIGMIYALSDEQKEIPIIGVYAKMIKV